MTEPEEMSIEDAATIEATIEAQINLFLLHPSFNSITSLVSQPLTGAANFVSWKRSMLIALSGKNKEGFINGKVKKPTNPKLAISWKCNNDIICSWIMNSVSKEIAASIIYNGNVQEIWEELPERFKESNGPRIFQLRKELATTTQGSLSVEVYFTKIKTIWQELIDYRPENGCTCGGFKSILDHMNSEYIMIFLMGLNDSYAAIRSQILLIEPLPSISKVFSLVIQEERQRLAGSSHQMIDPIALMAFDAKKGDMASSGIQSRRSNLKCAHCGYRGHVKDKCYKLHGYPPRYRPCSSSTQSENGQPSSNIGSVNVSATAQNPNFFSLV